MSVHGESPSFDCAPVGVQRTAASHRGTGERAAQIGGPVTCWSIDVEIAFTGVPVSELAAGRDFYGRLFGRPADVVVTDDEVIWRLAESTWPYVVVDTGHAGNALAVTG
jgi:hypothetical protein